MEEPIFQKESKAYFCVLAGIKSDLSTFDFSKVNIQCLKIDSCELKNILDESNYKEWNQNRNWDILEEIKTEFKYKKTDLYVLLPLDLSIEVDMDAFYSCWSILLLLFPSDLKICRIISFQVFDDKYIWWYGVEEMNFYDTGERTGDNFLIYSPENTDKINKIIRVYFERVSAIGYIKNALDSYVSSYSEMLPTMSYLSLCISLESIVSSTNELSYRIRRNIAVLCGKSSEHAEIIFNNLGKIYELRSKIVHAGNYNYEKVIEYLPYLQSIVSRMIIEVLLINITNLDELNKKLTFAGFYTKEGLSKEYEEIIYIDKPDLNLLHKLEK